MFPLFLLLLILSGTEQEPNRPGSLRVLYPFSFDINEFTDAICQEYPQEGSQVEIDAADALCSEMKHSPHYGGIVLEAAVEQAGILFSRSLKLGLREQNKPFEPSNRDGWHSGVLKRLILCTQNIENADFASISSSRSSGYTALHLATLFQFSWAVEIIADLGVNIDAPDSVFKMTPLHLASINHDSETARILINAGASVTSKDIYRRTPYDIAVALSAQNVAEVMSQHFPETCSASIEKSDVLYEIHANSFDTAFSNGGWRVNISRTISNSKMKMMSELRCSLDRLDSRSTSANQILQDYVSIGKPFILTHAFDDWPSRTRWTKNTFRTQFGEHDLLAGNIPYSEIFGGIRWGRASMAEFLDYMDSAWLNSDTNKEKLYVFDSEFLNAAGGDCCPLPEIFGLVFNEFDYVSQFILGPADSGSPQHFHSDAINCLVFGRKYWILAPPSKASYLKEGAKSWMSRQSGLGSETSGCLQKAGEIMYVPRFWGHSVLNFDECVAVAFEFDRGAEC